MTNSILLHVLGVWFSSGCFLFLYTLQRGVLLFRLFPSYYWLSTCTCPSHLGVEYGRGYSVPYLTFLTSLVPLPLLGCLFPHWLLVPFLLSHMYVKCRYNDQEARFWCTETLGHLPGCIRIKCSGNFSLLMNFWTNLECTWSHFALK